MKQTPIFHAPPTGTPQRYAATIGFFDGVHRGHHFLLQQLLTLAGERALAPMVITFDRHPRQVVDPQWQPQLLTTTDEKQSLLEAEGAGCVVVLPFDEQMAQLSARSFMQEVLARQLGVKVLLMGYDNRFGHRCDETFDDYVAYGRDLGIDVVRACPLASQGQCFSSSMVRQLLAGGDVGGAAQALGRNYQLSGSVVHGHEIGRTLGFPTANIQPDNPLKMVPRPGVYAVTVASEPQLPPHPAVMNIGHRPTFSGHRLTLEAHLLDYAGDLYEQRLTVSFVARIRDEQHFDSPESLIRQMQADARQARALFESM